MSEPRVILSNDLGEFFRQEVANAKGALRMELSEVAEFYLVNLLCDFSRPRGDVELGDEPLALMYKRAMEATPAERLQLLKHLGDFALYVAGFFTEFIERSLVDVGYYVSMGGTAYGSLSGFWGAQPRGGTFAELYEQLARRFNQLVELLNEVSDRARDKTDGAGDVLRLYERWLRTGSQRVQRRLHERGLFVTDTHTPDDELQ